MKGYMKSAIAALGALLIVLQTVLNPDGPGGQAVTVDEWIVIVDAVLTAVLVYLVPNLQTGAAEFAKSVVAGAFAVTSVLAAALIGGLNPSEVINLVIIFGTAAGVFLAPAPKHPF
jgi:drug/metabolite transporter (DMT)-like permease